MTNTYHHGSVFFCSARYRAAKLWCGLEGDSYRESGLDRLCVCAHGEGVLQRQHMCLEREREGAFVMEGMKRLCVRNTFVESVRVGMT